MIEAKQLPNVVLILVGSAVLMGIGVIVLFQFSEAVRTNTAVTHENLTIASSAGTLAYAPLVSNPTMYNGTNASIGVLTLNDSINFTLSSSQVEVDPTYVADGSYNVSYRYWANTNASLVTNTSMINLGSVGTTWFSLIVVVVMLSVIMGLVLTAFPKR